MYASTLIAIVASFVAVSQAAVIMSYPSPVVYSKGIEFIAQKAIEQINIQSSDSYVEQIVAVLGAQSAPSGGTTVEFLVGPTTCMKDGFVPGACSLFDPTLTEPNWLTNNLPQLQVCTVTVADAFGSVTIQQCTHLMA